MASLQWFITTFLQFDRAFFYYTFITSKAVAIKICYFVFLLFAWSFGFFVAGEIKKHNKTFERGVFVFAVYFTIMMVLMFILWPGTWSWDDARILWEISEYKSFMPWQHFLSGLYQAVLLQVFPHPGALILIQNLIISICVAFCIVKIENSFGLKIVNNNIVDTLIKLIPFFTPPVLLYQYSGYRMGLYVYLELTMLVVAICANKDGRELSWKYCFLFAYLVVLVSCWRSESLFYMLFVSLLLLILNKRVISLSKKLVSIGIIVLAFFSVNSIQDSYLGNDNYKLVSMMGPYSSIVHAADFDEDKEQLEIINKVADIDKILANPDMDCEELYWMARAYKDEYTNEEFKDSVKAVVKLTLKYPLPVLKERWGMFIKSTGVTGAVWRINWQSITLFEQDNASVYDDFFQNKKYFPLFKDARAFLINLFSCNTASGEQIPVLRKIVWNAWIPMAVLVFAWINSIRKKDCISFCSRRR